MTTEPAADPTATDVVFRQRGQTKELVALDPKTSPDLVALVNELNQLADPPRTQRHGPSAPDTTAQPPPAPEEQWAPDPYHRYTHRYWDGARWTQHVSNGGAVTSDPVPHGR